MMPTMAPEGLAAFVLGVMGLLGMAAPWMGLPVPFTSLFFPLSVAAMLIGGVSLWMRKSKDAFALSGCLLGAVVVAMLLVVLGLSLFGEQGAASPAVVVEECGLTVRQTDPVFLTNVSASLRYRDRVMKKDALPVTLWVDTQTKDGGYAWRLEPSEINESRCSNVTLPYNEMVNWTTTIRIPRGEQPVGVRIWVLGQEDEKWVEYGRRTVGEIMPS